VLVLRVAGIFSTGRKKEEGHTHKNVSRTALPNIFEIFLVYIKILVMSFLVCFAVAGIDPRT
jgi:hypothetical protein